MGDFDEKGLMRLERVLATGDNLHVQGKRSGVHARNDDWYERWAETLDLSFMPVASADGSSVVICASCGYGCDEGDRMAMAKHFVAGHANLEMLPMDESTRWRFRQYLAFRIRQARLEYGVPNELLEMRRRLVVWRCNLLGEDETKILFKWLKKSGCRVGKIGG
jgi:hypothetical protein